MLSGLLTGLLILVALVLIVLVIVLQQGNEGGIGSAFGSGNSAGFFGASGGVTLIVRATWICGALFFGIATTLAWIKTHQHFGVSREINESLQQPVAPAATRPVVGPPTAVPATEAPRPTGTPLATPLPNK